MPGWPLNRLRRAGRPVAVGVAMTMAVAAGCSSGHSARTASSSTTTTPSISVPTTVTTTTTAPTATTVPGPPGGPVPPGFQPASVTFVSAQRGYALGTAPCSNPVCTSLLRTVDGGRTWAGIPAPGAALGQGEGNPGVSLVRFADASDGWVFGSDLWSTHDGGSHWTRVSLPGAAAVDSLEVSGGSAFALGVQGGQQTDGGPAQVFQTPVGSDAWKAVAGTAVSGATSGVLVASGGGAVWAVVQTAGGGAAFLAGSPAGWQHRSLPCAQPTQAVAASSGTNMAAVCSGGGAAGSESKQLYVSSDAGATWRGTTAAPLGGDTFGVTSASPSVDVISAASGASELYATFDGGGTWSTVFQDTTGRPWRDLGFTTPNQGVVVEGVVPPMSGAGNQLLMTRDGGHSWAVVAF